METEHGNCLSTTLLVMKLFYTVRPLRRGQFGSNIKSSHFLSLVEKLFFFGASECIISI